jgi:serine protease Do
VSPVVRLIAGVLALSGTALPAVASPSAEVMMQLSRVVLKVSALGDDDQFSVGSAVVIGPDTALTNCHVTRHAHTIVLSRGMARHAVVGERADTSRDLCLLRTAEALPYPAAELRPAGTLVPGERVIAHGYSGGMEPQFARGIVLDLHGAGGSHIIQTTAGFKQGASGGGLFDEAGRLVGLTTFLTSAQRTEYFAVPADWADRLRERPELPPKPLTGDAFWAQPAERQPHFMRLLEPLARADWPRVMQLTDTWMQEEPHVAAAALMCARAAHALQQTERSARCIDRAIEMAGKDEIELRRIAGWALEAGREEARLAAVTALARLGASLPAN